MKHHRSALAVGATAFPSECRTQAVPHGLKCGEATLTDGGYLLNALKNNILYQVDGDYAHGLAKRRKRRA